MGRKVQVVGFGDAEVPPGVFEVFVGAHRVGGVQGARIDAGADHVDPIECGLGGDLVRSRRQVKLAPVTSVVVVVPGLLGACR